MRDVYDSKPGDDDMFEVAMRKAKKDEDIGKFYKTREEQEFEKEEGVDADFDNFQ